MYIRNPDTNKWEEVFLPPTGDTLPVGSISAYGGEKIPTNWLKCNGEAISRTDYPDLFKAIGTTYGSGDGSKTFNLPDLSERVAVGNAGDGEFSLGTTGGEKTHTLTVDEMPSHNHTLRWDKEGGTGSGNGVLLKDGYMQTTYNYLTANTGGSKAHNNMQPYIALNFIIKAKQSVGVVGTVTSNINDINDNAVPNAKTVKSYASKKVATANLSNAVTMTIGKISLNVINTSTSLLTLSDGGIKIGKGISKILINANVFGNAKGSNTSYLWIYIKKNQETIAIALNNPTSWYVSTALSSKLIDVAEGDVIWLYKQDDVSTEIRSGANTWLTVEVVE
jgi:microcystin-dependent protein